MKITQLLLADFMSLFTGNIHNYGRHIYAYTKDQGQKEKGTNSTITDRLITIEEYKNH